MELIPAGGRHPRQLLDDYLVIAERRRPGSLAATVLRTRSVQGRVLLAHQALGERGTLDDLLAAARTGDTAWLAAQRGRTRPDAVAELLRVIGLQDLLPTDTTDALAGFDLVLDAFGPDRISPLYQGFHLQLAFRLGRYDRVRELLGVHPRVPRIVRQALTVDLLNPFVAAPGGDVGEWFTALRALVPDAPIEFLDRPDLAPFDRLRAGPAEGARPGGELVSVIVTAYRPDQGLRTAVASVLAQSWTDLEVIVVDDGSPPEYDDVLTDCAALDPRVRLLRRPHNAGTYAARAAGLDAAAGAYVTFHDSDDWAHPHRLAVQATALGAAPAVLANTTTAVGAGADLVLTIPGKPEFRRLNTSSLMFRRSVVCERIGYFDAVRKAADSEYMLRIRAAFGEDAVQHLDSGEYAFIRITPTSLSRSDFRPDAIHPARMAYRTAYLGWHERIRAGAAEPYRPRHPAARAFPAPRHIAGGRSAPFDVLLAGDWCSFGGPQKSMLEEVAALTGRGLRVGIMHLEPYRFMSPVARPLCPAALDLLGAGTVEQVFLTDEVVVNLLVVRYPPVLQFAPAVPSRIRPRRVVVLANQAPREADGSDWRYVPRTCTEHARELFGVEPTWCPQGPAVRAQIAPDLAPANLEPFDMPGIIDTAQWRIDRTGFRSDRAVLGKHSRDHWSKWPGDARTLLQVYPDSDHVDTRFMGGAKAAEAVLGGAGLPPDWHVYGLNEIGVRNFLYQLDFYVYFPHPRMVEAFGRAVLEALAVGCVTVLPPHFRATFGDAAVYCEAEQVPDVIRRYRASRSLFLSQSRAALDVVETTWSHRRYTELVDGLLS